MRYEERNDTLILVVEPGDERGAVLYWLHQWQQRYSRKRAHIIVMVPQNAVFRRPGDLRELQQAVGQREWGITLVPIIEGNERLRLWACPTYSDRDSDTLGETYRSGIATVASRTTSGSQRPDVRRDQRVRFSIKEYNHAESVSA